MPTRSAAVARPSTVRPQPASASCRPGRVRAMSVDGLVLVVAAAWPAAAGWKVMDDPGLHVGGGGRGGVDELAQDPHGRGGGGGQDPAGDVVGQPAARVGGGVDGDRDVGDGGWWPRLASHAPQEATQAAPSSGSASQVEVAAHRRVTVRCAVRGLCTTPKSPPAGSVTDSSRVGASTPGRPQACSPATMTPAR